MKKIKFLLMALTLIISFGFINVSAEGIAPNSITTKEELIYYIYYYGGTAKVNGNTVVLTKNLTLNKPILFNNTEYMNFDLNGNSITFNGSGAKITTSASKGLKITNSNKSSKSFIKATNEPTIYLGTSGETNIENIELVTTGDRTTIVSNNRDMVTINNCNIINNKSAIAIEPNSKMNIKNSNIKISGTLGENAITTKNNTNLTLTNTNVTVDDYSKEGIAILGSNSSNIVINSGKYSSYKNTVLNDKGGKLTINGGEFISNGHALKTAGNTTINGGVFTSNSQAGIQILNGTENTLINSATLISKSTTIGALVIDSTSTIDKYIPKTSVISNKETMNSFGMTYTKEKNITVASRPKTKNLSTTSYTYNGNVREPSVAITNYLGQKLVKGTDYKLTYQNGRKNVGKYSIKITYTGKYSNVNQETLYFTINPKSTYMTSLTKGKKSITVKIKSNKNQTTGYQIMYSTSKNFKNSKSVKVKNTTTKKQIKNLKSKKKYYVKVRTYKNAQGNTYYSSWSKVKTVKTK